MGLKGPQNQKEQGSNPAILLEASSSSLSPSSPQAPSSPSAPQSLTSSTSSSSSRSSPSPAGVNETNDPLQCRVCGLKCKNGGGLARHVKCQHPLPETTPGTHHDSENETDEETCNSGRQDVRDENGEGFISLLSRSFLRRSRASGKQ